MEEPRDNLDQLLGQAPPPGAPPWFEQRLMARIRSEESEKARPFFAWSWRFTPLVGGVALLLVGAFAWQGVQSPSTTPTPDALVQEEIYQGFDAFADYREQSRTWSVEW
jgi:hypothetical protein